MGLEDIAQGAKEDHEEDETEELKDELGVDDIGDLEEVDDRLRRVLESTMTHDKKLEELESDILIIKKSLSSVIRDIREMKGEPGINPGEEDETDEDDEPPSSEVKERWQ